MPKSEYLKARKLQAPENYKRISCRNTAYKTRSGCLENQDSVFRQLFTKVHGAPTYKKYTSSAKPKSGYDKICPVLRKVSPTCNESSLPFTTVNVTNNKSGEVEKLRVPLMQQKERYKPVDPMMHKPENYLKYQKFKNENDSHSKVSVKLSRKPTESVPSKVEHQETENLTQKSLGKPLTSKSHNQIADIFGKEEEMYSITTKQIRPKTRHTIDEETSLLKNHNNKVSNYENLIFYADAWPQKFKLPPHWKFQRKPINHAMPIKDPKIESPQTLSIATIKENNENIDKEIQVCKGDYVQPNVKVYDSIDTRYMFESPTLQKVRDFKSLFQKLQHEMNLKTDVAKLCTTSGNELVDRFADKTIYSEGKSIQPAKRVKSIKLKYSSNKRDDLLPCPSSYHPKTRKIAKSAC